ncbi:hypothetical protein [Ekhidna sp.]|uniref:hypothetical protein n=1 Tax=Ekhidna sp. TaxID=2608089 RepID=UPI003BAD25B0
MKQLNPFQEEVYEIFSEDLVDLTVCFFSTNESTDIDIALFGTSSNVESQLESIGRILSSLKDRYQIFTDLNDLLFIEKRKKFIHLLYYPTPLHFKAWEVLSFANSIYHQGIFIPGKPPFLKVLAEQYINSDPFTISSFERQSLAYCRLALRAFIYANSMTGPKVDNYVEKIVNYIYIHLNQEMDTTPLKKKLTSESTNQCSLLLEIISLISNHFNYDNYT